MNFAERLAKKIKDAPLLIEYLNGGDIKVASKRISISRLKRSIYFDIEGRNTLYVPRLGEDVGYIRDDVIQEKRITIYDSRSRISGSIYPQEDYDLIGLVAGEVGETIFQGTVEYEAIAALFSEVFLSATLTDEEINAASALRKKALKEIAANYFWSENGDG